MTVKRIFLKTSRVIAIVFVSLLILIIIFVMFINTQFGRNIVKNKVQSYLIDKLKTKVAISRIDYSLPKWIELKGVYIEDQKHDTLFSGEELRVDINMVKLLSGNTDIQKLFFKNMFINIKKRTGDTAYNFQFVMNAFTGNKQNVNPDTASLKISLDNLVFENVALRFNDEEAGSSFYSHIRSLNGTLTRFQPDRMQFFIDDFSASGVEFNMLTTKATAPKKPDDNVIDSTINYPLIITANRFKLDSVLVYVKDQTDGFLYTNSVNHLQLGKVVFDMGKYLATADTLILGNSTVQLNLPPTKSKKDTGTSVTQPWRYAANFVNLYNNNIQYDNNNAPRAGGLDPNHLKTNRLNVYAQNFLFTADTTSAIIQQLSFADAGGFILDSTHVNLLMTDKNLSAKELYVKTPSSLLQNYLEITYDSLSGIQKYPQNSTVNAKLVNSTLAFNDLYKLMPSLKEAFPVSDFANNTVSFNTELRGSLSRLFIPFLKLNGFSGTSITARGTLFNLTDPDRFSYDLEILNSQIKKRDFLKFVPVENRMAFAEYPELINFVGRLKGDKNNLSGNIRTSAQGLVLVGKINLTNISNPAMMKYDFNISQADLSKNFIEGFLPKESLPPGFNLPQRIRAKGLLKGSQNNFVTDLKLITSYGNANVKGSMKNIKDPQRVIYDMIISPQDFHVGKLLGQDSVIGLVTGTFKAKGRGFDVKTMVSDIAMNVQKFQFKNYTYNNIISDANFNNGLIISNGNINDENLVMQYDLSANVKGEYPTLNAKLNVDTAQLGVLKLYPDTLNVSFAANVNAQNLQPRQLDFSAIIDSSLIQTSKGFYALDSMALTGSSSNGIDSIRLTAPFANIHAGGAFDYDKISTAILQYIDRFYNIGTFPAQAFTDQQFAINGSVLPHLIVNDFIPDLQQFEKIDFSGNYSSAITDSALNFKATIPYLVYQNNAVRNGNIVIGSRNEKLNYTANFDTLHAGSNIFYGTKLNGAAAADSLSLAFITQDKKARDWFGLNASIHTEGPVYTFRLSDNMLLNYEKWTVAPGNFIEYGPKHLLVQNFNINSDTASIRINSQSPVVNSPVQVKVDNFNLSTISSFISNDTLFASGIMDADFLLSEFDKNIPAFTGNASVNDLQLMRQPIGNVQLNAQKKSESEIYTALTLSGNNNDVEMTGSYYLDNAEKEFNMRADVRRLNLATIQAFTGGEVQNASGNIHGTVDLNGKFADPRWNGELVFDTTQFTLAQFGTPYKIDNEKIIFNYPEIQLNDFSIKDASGHEMKINGNITSNSLMDYDLDLKLNAQDFVLINAKKAVNNQIYGFGSIDADIAVTGNSASPDIEGNVFVNDNSNLTIVLPERSFNKDESKRIVRFVDADTFKIEPPKLFTLEREPASNFAQYLNYNVNIEVRKAAKLNVIVDPATGDALTVQGDARLNAGVDPGGNIILAGNYELDKGTYELNYQFLQKKFNLIKGSTIDFGGDPTSARINITAEYIANTSARDLLSNEVSNVSSQLSNSFQQKIPFRVILYLTGVLSRPEINFDIQLPDENAPISSELRTTIDNKLAQLRGDQSATNKQVFSLLLFNRFVGEQSSDFFKGNSAGGGFNDIARQSVSQFLSEALNEVAANLFKGIDVDLNLNTYRDFGNGGNEQRTDLNVAVSKSLMNDRLVISVGTNVGIEGNDPAAKTQGASQGFSPDVTVGYKITPDGKYALRAYRRNQFEMVLDGYVIENGLAFTVTMDYDKFGEIFGRKRK